MKLYGLGQVTILPGSSSLGNGWVKLNLDKETYYAVKG